MNEAGVMLAHLALHLADGLQVGGGFHVAHGAADLNDSNVSAALFGIAADAALDLVGHMGDHLHGAAAVLAPQLPLHDGLVHLAGGHAGFTVQVYIHKALVMAQIQVSRHAVVGNKGLAVLQGGKQTGIHVVVRVALLHGDLVATGLHQPSEGRGCDPLAQGRDHTAGNKHELRCHTNAPSPYDHLRNKLLAVRNTHIGKLYVFPLPMSRGNSGISDAARMIFRIERPGVLW